MIAYAISVAEIAARLNDDISGVIAALRLDGEIRGHEYVAWNPTRDDRHLGSFRICLSGPKQGVWCEFGVAGRPTGDALDLVCYVGGIAKVEAIRWARRHLGLETGAAGEAPALVAKKREQKLAEKKKRDAATAGQAQRLFLSARAALRGTPADLYLRGRGIELARLGRQPGALRFHPACRHGPSGRDFPALVAAVTAADGAFCSIHRTFLVSRRGAWEKADARDGVADNKMTFGPYAGRGASIHLWRGETIEGNPGRPWKQMAHGETVMMSEGIEDGLTAVLAKPEWRACAAVSLSNMAAVRFPVPVRLVIVGQNDGHAEAVAQLQAAVAEQRRTGNSVRVPLPPAGFKDVNDQLRGRAS